jgi:hypothetical protein
LRGTEEDKKDCDPGPFKSPHPRYLLPNFPI